MWRIFAFDLSVINPAVIVLHLHLQDYQPVSFHEDRPLQDMIEDERLHRTMLTEFFAMNRTNKQAEDLNLLYKEFPQYFVWDEDNRIWYARKRGQIIGHVTTTHPIEGERYYLRMLLMHVRRPKSFTDLKTVNGFIACSFKRAAEIRGLLQIDNGAEQCLSEAAIYKMPSSLRQLFAVILIYCPPSNPKNLWDKFYDSLSEDIAIQSFLSEEQTKAKVLHLIDEYLQIMGKNIADFGFSQLTSTMSFAAITKEIEAEYTIPISEEDLAASSMLNHAQRGGGGVVTNVPAAFFIDGPGGTGKSFLYKALLATVRSRGDIALATTTSRAAASILPGGRTAHFCFKIPLQQEINSTCNISKQSAISKLVQLAWLIIWDEAAMAKKYAIESFDRLLKDLLSFDSIFSGKVIVFCGDFQQTLPVVRKGQREDYISTSLVNSYLWPHLEKIRLTENMRARSDPSFSDFLLKIGDRTEPTILVNKIKLPSSMLIPFIDDTTSLNLLINTVYASLFDFLTSSSAVTNRAILSTTNETDQEVNQILIQRFPGQETRYISFDQTLDPTKQADHGDFLNSIQPPGLPPHELILKPMCPVILLRNLNPAQGLCNGTRLICLNFDKNVIHAEIFVGIHIGKHVFIPRIPLHSSNDESYPIPFKRTQFPISLCFAMTINKSQGQTLDFVGIYLKEPVFSHGQLYVALSRAKTSANVKILLRPVTVHSTETSYTRNIVYHEILAAAADT
ncbi:uncharacterized protein [Coffea arabica]|uniref:ATP-dependent DNA helicase n=1 Tax=Coffea arabica TaxID=13443 RepID=A0ABM4X4Z8_COFAR